MMDFWYAVKIMDRFWRQREPLVSIWLSVWTPDDRIAVEISQ